MSIQNIFGIKWAQTSLYMGVKFRIPPYVENGQSPDYNAFENMFKNIAAVFENSAEDVERWHAQLLERMQLDVKPLRPAVIDDEAYGALDELRRFRHLFRHAYSIGLDPQRLQLVMNKSLALRAIYTAQFEQFLSFLQDLAEDA